MNFQELGTTGVKVSEIGLGTWQYSGGIEPLRAGLATGATWIDTAEVYGTEGVVGSAIKGLRERPFIATKVSGSNLKHKDVLKAADGSLKKLGIERIDLYQIHWPSDSVPIGETMQALEELVAVGKVRYIGVSNFDAAQTKAAQAALKKNRIVSNQVSFSLFDRGYERDLLPYCQEQQITLLAYSPLGRGAINGGGGGSDRKGVEALRTVAKETGKTPAQVALNWCLRPGVVAIPKSNSVERNRETCGGSGWVLASGQRQALESAFR